MLSSLTCLQESKYLYVPGATQLAGGKRLPVRPSWFVAECIMHSQLSAVPSMSLWRLTGTSLAGRPQLVSSMWVVMGERKAPDRPLADS